jgi:hypothetical protein
MNISTKIWMTVTLLLSTTMLNAQIKNSKTETVKISGNCGMCKSNIEEAGNVKKRAKVEWDRISKMATITYDSVKTSQDEILKRIALKGYDSEEFLAPDDAYASLSGCCQYDRVNKVTSNKDVKSTGHNEHSGHGDHMDNTTAVESQKQNQLKTVFDNYFALKDALIQTDGTLASKKAGLMLKAISSVKMGELSKQEHEVWMSVMDNLSFDAQHISESKEIEQQRSRFITLSENMHKLAKVSKQETPTYYQNCPMANDGKGANWLSKEKAVKNPYYGNKMLSCGKTVETIDK